MNKIFSFLVLVCLLFLLGCANSDLPKEMPEDFSFSIGWGYDAKYDSKTKLLSNGYNFDMEKACVTELELGEEDLEEIYHIIRKSRIEKYDEVLHPKFVDRLPSADFRLTITYADIKYSVRIENTYLSDNMMFYKEGKGIARAIRKIINDYIINTEEYKSLPENQLVYD